MSARVYVLIDVQEGKCDQVAQSLRGEAGVIMADVLESLPEVMMVVEASEQRGLAELTVRALASIEAMTEGLQLLAARNGPNTNGGG